MNNGEERRAQIVKSGTWLYDQKVPHEVWIVQQNFDYYYDEGFEDSPEILNRNDEVFHVVYAENGQVRGVMQACKSLDDAIETAEEKMPGIVWDNHRLQPLFYRGSYKLEE